jgi:hypothetical protein
MFKLLSKTAVRTSNLAVVTAYGIVKTNVLIIISFLHDLISL